jgi:transcription-repair coupling factor (superfamily II helicase)
MANLEQPEQAEAMAAELADRFGPPPEPVANLLAVTQLKTEAAALGVEGVSARDGEVTIKLKRTIAPDRVALYKRYKTDARVQLGEVRLPRRRFAEGQTAFLRELRELLPVIVGAHREPAVAGTGAAR